MSDKVCFMLINQTSSSQYKESKSRAAMLNRGGGGGQDRSPLSFYRKLFLV